MSLKNYFAMQAGQSRHDNAQPADDGGRADHVAQEANLLMLGLDADQVAFLPYPGITDFATIAQEVIGDKDNELLIARIIIALIAGAPEKATDLAKRFEPFLYEKAVAVLTKAMESTE